jgi:hypothetical protein
MRYQPHPKDSETQDAVRSLMMCTYLYYRLGGSWVNDGKKYIMARGAIKVITREKYIGVGTYYVYEDDKVFIEAELTYSEEYGTGFIPKEIAVKSRWLWFFTRYEIVSGVDKNSEVSIFRIGRWCDYVIELGNMAQKALAWKHHKEEQEQIKRENAKEKLRQKNSHPIDDSDIFR